MRFKLKLKHLPPTPRRPCLHLHHHPLLPSSSSSSIPLRFFSTPPHSSSSSSSSSFRRYDEESRNVRVSVWWDFENCGIPASINVYRVSHCITAAIRASGIKGPIQITAFGDVLQLSRSNQEALSSTAINLAHVPRGGKNSADRSLLVDLMYWVSHNPPPAHIFLISGDRDFASILHRLRMNNYNILLASNDTAPAVLWSAASIMWPWCDLVKGENLVGKYFNQPPDGPLHSWYGHYKLPLEDPYSSSAFQSQSDPPSSTLEEPSEPAPSDPKLHPIPRPVVRQIRHILSLYPKGLSDTELCTELGKSNIVLDKDLYGYKKLHRFLLSMPHILKVQFKSDGRLSVHGLTPRVAGPVISKPDTAAAPTANSGVLDSSGPPLLLNHHSSSITKNVEVNTELSSQSHELKSVHGKSEAPMQSHELQKVAVPPTKVPKPFTSPDKEIADVTSRQPTDVHRPPVVEQNYVTSEQSPEAHPPVIGEGELTSTLKIGFLQKLWKRLFVQEDNYSEKNTSKENVITSKEKLASSFNSVPPVSHTSQVDDSVQDKKVNAVPAAGSDKSSESAGFIHRLKIWWSGPTSETSSGHSSVKSNHINRDCENHKIFSTESFCVHLATFLDSPRGTEVIERSSTREQVAQNLHKEGPPCLSSIKEHDVLHLVGLLISEKNWVEECASQSSPFKLNRPVIKEFLGAHGSVGLSSNFLSEEIQKSAEHDGQKKNQISHPHASQKPPERSRGEILSDCQKLVAELLKEYPKGFNMGIVRRRFPERFGYPLDYQMLGFSKFASLLETLPGVSVNSTYVLPVMNAPQNSFMEVSVPSLKNDHSKIKFLDKSRNEDDDDSLWKELGPIESSFIQNETALGSGTQKAIMSSAHSQNDYQYCPVMDDSESSESEDDGLLTTVSGARGKPGVEADGSSLVQILDSWYRLKGDDSRKEGRMENINGMMDCSKNASNRFGSAGLGNKSEANLMGGVRKQQFLFVEDREEKKTDHRYLRGQHRKAGHSLKDIF